MKQWQPVTDNHRQCTVNVVPDDGWIGSMCGNKAIWGYDKRTEAGGMMYVRRCAIHPPTRTQMQGRFIVPAADGLLLCCEHGAPYAVLILYAGKSVLEVFDFMSEVHDTDVVRFGPAVVGTCPVCATTNSDSVDSSLVVGDSV